MPKAILEKMRNERCKSLREYRDVLDKIDLTEEVKETLLKQRRAMLVLELPFKTDTVNVNAGLVDELAVGFNFTKEGFSKKEWLYAKSKEDQWERKSFLNRLHKEKILPLMCQVDGMNLEVPIEDFHRSNVYQLLKIKIKNSAMKESIKKKTLSQLHSLVNYLGKDPLKNWDTISSVTQSGAIDISVLARYFEFLEARFFSSNSKEAVLEFIEIKLIFYADLPSRILNETKFSDVAFGNRYKKMQKQPHEQYAAHFMARKVSRKKKGYVKKQVVIDLPRSFHYLLSAALKPDDVLISRSGKQLYRLVTRTVAEFDEHQKENRREIKGWLTPYTLKKARKIIQLINNCLEQKLPGR